MLNFSTVKRNLIIGLALLFLFGSAGSLSAHVALDAPNGGEMLEGGQEFTIVWQVVIEHDLIDWDLEYSLTGISGPWLPIATDLPPGDPSMGSVHTYDWTVPFENSSQVRVRVTQDNASVDYTDISMSDFTITSEPKIFSFLIEPEQADACAGTGTTSGGFGIAVLSADQSQLSVYAEFENMVATGAHIHNAPACTNGPIAHAFTSTTSPIHETWNLSSSDVNELLDGNLYINMHSAAFPGGEIRGQIVREPINFIFTMDEAQANEGNGTGSFYNGFAVAELDSSSEELSVSITHDIPSADLTAGHIHLGAPGDPGPAQHTLSSLESPIDDTWMPDTLDLRNLLRGDLYVNLHTNDFPGGEIRGQIEQTISRWTFNLTDEEVSGSKNGMTSRGFCVLELNDRQDELSIYCEHEGSGTTLSGGIFKAAPGLNGSSVFTFSNAQSPIDETWQLSPQDVDDLLADSFYVQINSDSLPEGAARGQVDRDPMQIDFALTGAAADACMGTGSDASGSAVVTVKPGSREMTVAIDHDVANPVDGHIHLGEECVSGPVQFPFESAISPVMEVWYMNKSELINLLQKKLYANIHSDEHPAGEIRGQLAIVEFLCGDSNGDEAINVSDAVYIINFVFAGGTAPDPIESADANCDMDVNVSDAVWIINSVFSGGNQPCDVDGDGSPDC